MTWHERGGWQPAARLPAWNRRMPIIPAVSAVAPVARLLALAPLLLVAACGGNTGDAIGAAASAAVDSALTDPASGADCGGKDLHLTRDGGEWVIHGECRDIVITASNGSLNVDKARSIRVQGSHFTVLNEDVARVDVAGDGHTLNLTRAEHVVLKGDGNLVLARHIDAVEFGGKENTVNVDNQPSLQDAGAGNRVL